MSFHISYAGDEGEFLPKVRAVEQLLKHVPTVLDRLKLGKAHQGLAGVQVIEEPDRGHIAFHYDRSADTISLYPSFFSKRPDADVYEAFGQRHWEKSLSQTEHTQWINAMVYPTIRTLEKFSELIRKGCYSYKQILDSFTDPDDRLVVIHLINALQRNHTSPKQAQWLDLVHYPPTAAFMTAKAAYSARPILATYRPGHDGKGSYAKAFAEYCVNNGKFLCTVDSVGALYKALFAAVTFQ